MGQSPSGKGDLRGAAERLERGIERYGEGDLAGALIEFEAALQLYPSSARGKQFAAWVKDVQAGRKSISGGRRADALDEDALRAVDEALEDPPSKPPSGSFPPAIAPPERTRKGTPLPPTLEPPPPYEGKPPSPSYEGKPPSSDRQRRLTPPTRAETAPTMAQLASQPATPPRVTRDAADHHESPWDPVPLTPGGQHEVRRADVLAELQSSATKAAPPPPKLPPEGSSATILGMPPLEPKLLTPQRKRKVQEDRPESVTREFRSATPTGPNLRPLDVPELTEEQIQGLLSLDSPLLPEGRTTPQIELDRIDELNDSQEQRLIELEAMPTPLPHRAPEGLNHSRKNDTNPMGVSSFAGESGGEFEPQQLTPTGVKASGLKAVREPSPEDDPYADLNLLPLEVAPDLAGADENEEGGTNPTNPFIRGAKLAAYTSYGTGGEPKLEDMPPLPKQPTGTHKLAHPLATAEAALQAGDVNAAVDACERALAQSGGLAGNVARDHLPLVEQIYGAILIAADRVPRHGHATADLEPRSAFLLSRIDGSMTVEDVLDVSGMPRLEALRTMALLARRGAIVIT
ncbi:MAG: hypothetical protein JWN44_3185 [Myxococcales bacterium]|nr:hypothetical protein [Myxococcales bacterium]